MIYGGGVFVKRGWFNIPAAPILRLHYGGQVRGTNQAIKKSAAKTCESGDGFGGEKNLSLYMEFYLSGRVLSSTNKILYTFEYYEH